MNTLQSRKLRLIGCWAFTVLFILTMQSVSPLRGSLAFASPVLSVPSDVTGTPGQVGVSIPINVSDATGIAGVDITLTFSSSILTATDVQTTSLTSGFSLVKNITSGQVVISMARATGISSGSGSLVNVIFSVSSSASPGATTVLTLQSTSLFDENALSISHTKQNGLFTVGGSTNNPPNMPNNVSPSNGTSGLSLTPTLQGSAFSDPDAGDTHAASQWQVDNDSGFGSIEFDSGETATEKTTIVVPSGKLAYLTTYYWRVRYKDNRGGWSNWSSPTNFTTQSGPVTRVVSIPTDSSGAPGQTGITVPINVSDATGIAGVDITLTFNGLILTVTDVQTTSLTSGFSLVKNITSGQVVISMARATGISSGSGALVNVIFSVSGSASPGATTPLTLLSTSLFDENALSLSHTKQDGLFTVCSTFGTPVLSDPSNGAAGVSTTPTLDWGDVSGATSYDVQLCSDSGCSSVVQTQTSLSFSQWKVSPPLSNGTQYWWRARGNNLCGPGSWSGTWSFTTVGQRLSAPTLSSPSNGASEQPYSLSLQWVDTNSAPQEQGYRVRMKPEGGSYSTNSVGQNVTSYAVSGLLPYTKYYWNVQAVGNGTSTLDSLWANGEVDWTFTTVGQRLSAPTLSSPSNGASEQPYSLSLQWVDTNSAPQEQGYRVRIKPEGESYSNYTTGQNATSYPVSGLLLYTKYYWNVQAVGNGSSTLDSDWANGGTDWSFTTIHSQPFPFVDDFSTDKGWFGYEVGGWERKPAHGGGGAAAGNPDPGTDYTGTSDNYILGYAIGGDYANGISEEKSVISPPIDCTGQDQVFLKFRRWLNVESNKFDHAGIDVRTDGMTWEPVWVNPPYDLTDDQWTQAVFDISDLAANEPTVYIRFTMGPTNSTRRFSGWNIDDLEVTSKAIYPVEGTVGTQISIPGTGFGLKIGKVLIGGMALKILEWRDTSIVGTISKTMLPGVYDLSIHPKVGGEVVHEAYFSIMKPQIDLITPSSGSNPDEITVTGKYFGTKKGKIYLGGKSCKVTYWWMDPVSGDSQAKFIVPKKIPWGPQDLAITNSVGSYTEDNGFTIE